MTWTFTGFLLALFGLSLILITLSLQLLRNTAPAGDTSCSATRFFLIGLRVAIGWHCFVEGMDKISKPNWSSETYLRESMGPCSGFFRWVAGDRLIERVTVGPDDAFPPRLDREWRAYLNAYAAYYDLNAEQLQRAEGIFEQRKKDSLTYLMSKSEVVTKISAVEPKMKPEMTIKQRLDEHDRLKKRVADLEAKFPSFDKKVEADWKKAKADLTKWRDGLEEIVNVLTTKFTKGDDAEWEGLKKLISKKAAKLKETKDSKKADELKKEVEELTARLRAPLDDVLTSEQKLKGPMPAPAGTPILSWRLLEVADFLVKWSLAILGMCLMLGLFSRASSLTTALMILSFYAVMPPLPLWPESPKLEGHYLLFNKTLVEVIALLALTFIPTGRWAGLDGLISLWCCGGARGQKSEVGSQESEV